MADSRNGAGNSSRPYALNTWMWRSCRGQALRFTVAEAELQRKAATSDARTRAAETLKRCRNERGADYYSKDPREQVMDLPKFRDATQISIASDDQTCHLCNVGPINYLVVYEMEL